MTAATRKASERARRKAEGQVEYKGWLTASDHAALTQMARDSGMTQGQVVGRLIGMVGRIEALQRMTLGDDGLYPDRFGPFVLHPDLTAAVGLTR